MGLCCSSEDTGKARAADVSAVNANSTSITNDDLLQLQTDFSKSPKQQLMLRFAGRELANLDSGSKSDTFVVVYAKKGTNKTKLGQTECIQDNLNPDFVKAVIVDFLFEESQKFMVELYDADDMNQL